MLEPAEMPERLEAFLRAVDPTAQTVRVLEYSPISGGYSRLMARAEVEWVRNGHVSLEPLILRGDPPPGQAFVETDRGEEWAVLQALTADGTVPMPAARWFDPDGTALGTPCIVMDLVDGPSLIAACQRLESYGDLPQRLVDLLAAAHSVDPDGLPPTMHRPAQPEQYLDQFIDRFRHEELQHPESEPFLRYTHGWLKAHRPPAVPLTLVHGDMQTSNILVAPDDTLTLIDWELAHIGDPREDLGWCKFMGQLSPPDLLGVDEAALCARYRERTGLNEEQLNPWVLNYFLVLSTITVYGKILEQKAVFADGTNQNLTTPYVNNAVTQLHQLFMAVISALDSALPEAGHRTNGDGR